MSGEIKPIEVSRRIEAPAAPIFEVLANPQRHMDFDGSGMLRVTEGDTGSPLKVGNEC